MKKLLRVFILLELCLIAVAGYVIYKPRYSIEDIKVDYLRNKIALEKYEVLKNYYILDSLDTLYNDIFTDIDNLKNKEIIYITDTDKSNRSLLDYLYITDVVVNDTDLTGFDIELNYLDRPKKQERIQLINTFYKDKYINDVVTYYESFNESMRGPSAKMTGEGIQVTDVGKEGKQLDKEKLLQDITSCLEDYITKDILGEVQISYNVIKIEPSVEDVQAINTKVSSFSTGYSSSGSSRKTNVAVATNYINGTLVAPGQTISVDKMIKSRVAANGYQKAGSYQNGRTVQTYGGGVCQVSSTLYGAVLRAGLVPVERNPHSMAVSYVPLGLDAAIAEGYKDLKITNTYDTPIFITGSANGSTVTFNIYGKEGLLEGYTYQPGSSSSKNGLYANSWLNKYKDGELVEKIELFESSYRPHG